MRTPADSEVDACRVSSLVRQLSLIEVGVQQAALSLLDPLATVPGPRSARGVRHGVLAVLLASACAVLAGTRWYVTIAEYLTTPVTPY